ncbi:ATP-binding domain-containing protein [Arthrobacter monumenti]
MWERLRLRLPDDVVLAHSVHVRNSGVEHEIDLLVLWPGVGLAAIEVKGGLVRVDNAQWQQSDKGGWRNIKSPVAQCQSSKHAFKSWIGDQLGTPITSRFADMVCFPYTEVPRDWSMAGYPRELILGEGDIVDPAVAIRRAIEKEGSGISRLTPSYLERIARRLQGDFDSIETVSGSTRELEDEQDHLTEGQSVLLSATRSLTRVRYTGGAGSGKTWLAVEKARRLCKEGKKVGLICYNKGLGQYLKNQMSGRRQATPSFTGEFHEYAKSLGVVDGSGQEYFEIGMPRQLKELAEGLPLDRKLDAVVVDEAQDIAPLWWDSLVACLKDPSVGQIHAFMDDGQDVYRRWQGAEASGDFNTLTDLVPIHIDENLRNTRKITETFRCFTDNYFTPRASSGLPVRRVECPTDDALEVASDCVDALIKEGWANNQIVLLTTRHRHPMHQEHFEQGTLDEYWREFHADEAEFYGHVLGFKGLERSAVVLCVDGFKDPDRAAEQLYVGLSRARSLLVVVGDSELLAEAGGNQLALALSRTQSWRPLS